MRKIGGRVSIEDNIGEFKRGRINNIKDVWRSYKEL